MIRDPYGKITALLKGKNCWPIMVSMEAPIFGEAGRRLGWIIWKKLTGNFMRMSLNGTRPKIQNFRKVLSKPINLWKPGSFTGITFGNGYRPILIRFE